jgi:hypothetical protein
MTLFVRFQILLLSALSAHWLAGGTLVQSPNLLWQGLALGAFLFALRNIKLEGPSLALLILFIQSSSHFVLGGGTYLNATRMTLAHLLSGVLAYAVVTYFEIVWDFIASAFIALVPARNFLRLSLPGRICCIAIGTNSTFQIRQLTASLKFRGPPLAWEN